MILQNSVKQIIENNAEKNPLYLRNLIKEEIQNYILNFVFNSKKYNKLIFTGGTCLRKVYGLNRLSEDIDFDYTDKLNIKYFAESTSQYFKSFVKYPDISYSISGNKKTVFFKFPILKELEIFSDRTPEDIFVRCDFSEEKRGGYTIDKNIIFAGTFQFFVSSYDLSTMFANKLAAFLERTFYKGKLQKIPFKGRDIYDLFWIMQLSAKSSFTLKMNEKRLKVLFGEKNKNEIKSEFRKKIELIDKKFLYDDLFPLLESRSILDGFINSYKQYLPKYIDFVI